MDLSKLRPEDYVKLGDAEILAFGDFLVASAGDRLVTCRMGQQVGTGRSYYRPKWFPLGDNETIKEGDRWRKKGAKTADLKLAGVSLGTFVRNHSSRLDYFRPNPAYQETAMPAIPDFEVVKVTLLPPKPVDPYAAHNQRLLWSGIESGAPSWLTTPTYTPVVIHVQEQHPDAPDVGAKDAR